MNMSNIAYDKLTGIQKTSILLIALGREGAADIFRHLKDGDVERLAVEISKMNDVPAQVMEAVLEEFHQMIVAQEYISRGGIDFAKSALEQAMGANKAHSIVNKVEGALHVDGFSLLKNADPTQLINFIQNEHPQTIAMILANLDPDQTASIIAELAPDVQADVAYRIATMGRISPDLVKDIEKLLEDKVDTVFGKDINVAGGAKAVADILNNANRATEKVILEDINERNPELSSEIKNLMFTFDDLERIDDRTMQRILREVDGRVLSLSLKIASEELKEKIFSNLSDRAATYLRQELEFMGPVRLKEVEDSQTQIVDIVRSLEEDGELYIPLKNNEEEYVS